MCSLAYKRVLAKADAKRLEAKKGLSSNRQSNDKLDKIDKTEIKLDKIDKIEKLEKLDTQSPGSNSRHSFVDKISPLGENNSQSGFPVQKDKPVGLTSGVSLTSGEKSTPPPSFASSLAFLRDHKEEKSNDSADMKLEEEENQDKTKSRHHHHHHHHKHKHHKRLVRFIVD